MSFRFTSVVAAALIAGAAALPASATRASADGISYWRISGNNHIEGLPDSEFTQYDHVNGVAIITRFHDMSFNIDGTVNGLADMKVYVGDSVIDEEDDVAVSGRHFIRFNWNENDFPDAVSGSFHDTTWDYHETWLAKVTLRGNGARAHVHVDMTSKETYVESGNEEQGYDYDYPSGDDRVSVVSKSTYDNGKVVYRGNTRGSRGGFFDRSYCDFYTNTPSLASLNADDTHWQGDAVLQDNERGTFSGGTVDVVFDFYQLGAAKPGRLSVSAINDDASTWGSSRTFITATHDDVINQLNADDFEGTDNIDNLLRNVTLLTPCAASHGSLHNSAALQDELVAAH